MERLANNATSTLAAALSSGATSLTVAAAAAFPNAGNFRIKIDAELLLVTAVAGNVFTVTRGAEGTTAAAHTSGSAVKHVLTAASLETFIGEEITAAIADLPTDADLTAVQSAVDDVEADVAQLESDVSDLTTEVAGKAAAVHTHAQADVTGLVAALAGKAASSHAHAQSDVTDLTSDLAAKAPLASPALTGVPTAPTAALGANTTQVATMAAIQAAIANLINSAPLALDTLNELATALGNDANFSATVTAALAGKAAAAHTHDAGDVTGGTLANARLSADVLLRTLVDAKGDLLVGTGADTVARLGVGANGQVVKANSATASGLEWADESGGGGGASVDYSTCALLAPAAAGGNDTTGTVGDFTLPYATAQAAWADGAKSMELLPNSASYGAIATSGAALELTIISRGYNGGYNQLGAITTGGGACNIRVLTGRSSLRVASINTVSSSTGTAGGALATSGLDVTGVVNTSGTNGDSNEPGGNGGDLTAEDSRFRGAVYVHGGSGGIATPTGNAGGSGGNAGAVSLDRSIAHDNVEAYGGQGGEGGPGDAENPAGDGGGGGTGATVFYSYCGALQYLPTFNISGGGTGSPGANSGGGAGNPGSGGGAGSFYGQFGTAQAITATGGGGVSAGSGGTITVDHFSVAGAVTLGDGDSMASGAIQASYASFVGGVVNVGTKAGFFVVEVSTTYDTYA